MTKFRIHGSDLRELGRLLAALQEDAALMAGLSFIEKELIQGASRALPPLFPIVDARDMEDSLNES